MADEGADLEPVDDRDDDRLADDLRTSLGTHAPDPGGAWRRARPSRLRGAVSTVTWDPARPGDPHAVLPDTSFTTEDWPIADYEPLYMCGRGAFGQVWIVRDRAGVLRALKILDLRSMRRHRAALRELEALRRYCKLAVHPHLISIFHIGQTTDCLYYTMELADDANTGESLNEADLDSYVPFTLRKLLQRDAPDRDRAVEITYELLAGLGHLHDADLAHRDVKPENIVFVGASAKLADIGMTTVAAPRAGGGGTPGYMPPDGRTDATADTYALSKVLFEVLAWPNELKLPWVPTALLDADDPQAQHLNELLLTGCASAGENRFAGAREMRAALESCRSVPAPQRVSGQPVTARPRMRWVAAALTLLATAAGAIGVWTQIPPREAFIEYIATVQYVDEGGRKQLRPLTRNQIVHAIDGLNVMIRTVRAPYLYVFLADERGRARQLFHSGPGTADDAVETEEWLAIPGLHKFLNLNASPPIQGNVRLYFVAATKREPVEQLAAALQRLASSGTISPRGPGMVGRILQTFYPHELHRTNQIDLSLEPMHEAWSSWPEATTDRLRIHTAHRQKRNVIVRSIEFTLQRDREAETP